MILIIAYRATFHLDLEFAILGLASAAVMHLIQRTRVISSELTWGLIGSAIGYMIWPYLANRVGLLTPLFMQPEHIARQWLGCISPLACGNLLATFWSGVLSGFCAGFAFAFLGWRLSRICVHHS